MSSINLQFAKNFFLIRSLNYVYTIPLAARAISPFFGTVAVVHNAQIAGKKFSKSS